MGEVKTRGAPEDRRIEVEIRGSESLGMTRRVKEWLKNESYFADPRRVLYVLRQHSKEELVVVEGALQSGEVGLITVFRRDGNTGLEKRRGGMLSSRTINAAIILYNGVFQGLLQTNADEQALDAALLDRVWYDQSHYQSQDLKEPGIPGWVVGPGGHHYQLGKWPPVTPFLHAAALFGCAKIVRQLVKRYGCDVNYPRKKDKATALHLAAYYGHSTVVEMLLELGADKTLKNMPYNETALESALKAQQEEMTGNFKMPTASKFADESQMLKFNPDGQGPQNCYTFDLGTTRNSGVEAKLYNFVQHAIQKLEADTPEPTDENEEDNYQKLVVWVRGFRNQLLTLGARVLRRDEGRHCQHSDLCVGPEDEPAGRKPQGWRCCRGAQGARRLVVGPARGCPAMAGLETDHSAAQLNDLFLHSDDGQYGKSGEPHSDEELGGI